MPSNVNKLEIIKKLFDSLTKNDKKVFLRPSSKRKTDSLKHLFKKKLKSVPLVNLLKGKPCDQCFKKINIIYKQSQIKQ